MRNEIYRDKRVENYEIRAMGRKLKERRGVGAAIS